MRTVDPVKHEGKRREILDAAERCFARKGFQGASISDICAEAGISPGRLYHYFPGKEAIVAAIMRIKLEAAMAWFARIMEENDPVALFVGEVGWLKDPHKIAGQALFLDMLAEAGRNPAMAAILREHHRKRLALLADFLRKGQECGRVDPGLDPEAAAGGLFSLFVGAKLMNLRDPEADLEKGIAVLQTMVLRFLNPGAA